MSIQKQKTVHICDRCGKSGVMYESGAFASAGAELKILSWARAYTDPDGPCAVYGAVGGATLSYDLCQSCSAEFEKWLKNK